MLLKFKVWLESSEGWDDFPPRKHGTDEVLPQPQNINNKVVNTVGDLNKSFSNRTFWEDWDVEEDPNYQTVANIVASVLPYLEERILAAQE